MNGSTLSVTRNFSSDDHRLHVNSSEPKANDVFGSQSNDNLNVFRDAEDTINSMISALNMFYNVMFTKIKQNSELARSAQDMSNRIDEVIAQASKGDDKTRENLPDDVIQFMREKGITIDGENIDNYIKAHGDSEGKLDQGELQAAKGAVDTFASRCTDVMSQMQLSIQEITQKITFFTTQVSGVIEKWFNLLALINNKTYS